MTWVLSYPGTPGWAGDQEEQGGTRVGRKKTIKGKKTGTGRGTGETMREGSKSGEPEGESRRGTRQEGGHENKGERTGERRGGDERKRQPDLPLSAPTAPTRPIPSPPSTQEDKQEKQRRQRSSRNLTDRHSLPCRGTRPVTCVPEDRGVAATLTQTNVERKTPTFEQRDAGGASDPGSRVRLTANTYKKTDPPHPLFFSSWSDARTPDLSHVRRRHTRLCDEGMRRICPTLTGGTDMDRRFDARHRRRDGRQT